MRKNFRYQKQQRSSYKIFQFLGNEKNLWYTLYGFTQIFTTPKIESGDSELFSICYYLQARLRESM